jgi:outer membrane protein OmpA-like peptidoglycan-associated protein
LPSDLRLKQRKNARFFSSVHQPKKGIRNMNDENDVKPQPPDDFSKTIIRSSSPKKDVTDWGKTLYGKEAEQASAQPDWGVTQPNINLSAAIPNQPPSNQPSGNEQNYGATTPYFQLPENDRVKYQQAQIVREQQVAAEQESKKSGGIPSWIWISLALLLMFTFAIAVLIGVYFIFLNKKGFDVTVKGAPAGSSFFVDKIRWSVSSADGSYKLNGLDAGERVIKIENPNWTCEEMKIVGTDGKKPEDLIARCRETSPQKVTVPISDDCLNIKNGEFDKSERCANIALDNLPDPFTADDLRKALNIYIINFEKNKFNIPPRNMKFLQRAATYILKLPPNTLLEVGGHTDNRGLKISNQPLSENRSKAVKEALVKLGVRTEMLETKGYADTQPKVSNDTEDGRFLNRRIEYKVLSK